MSTAPELEWFLEPQTEIISEILKSNMYILPPKGENIVGFTVFPTDIKTVKACTKVHGITVLQRELLRVRTIHASA